jgi:hypothetical protein
MTSPIPPSVSKRETTINRFAGPSVRIFAATIILVTGAGVAAIFWKMPKAAEFHALYHEGVVDQELAAVPLPSAVVAAISSEEMQQINLPRLGVEPVLDEGIGRYAQAFPAPAPLAMINAEQSRSAPEEETFAPNTPQRFVPIRQVIEEKPISVEPVNRDFAPMPTTVSTTERSDELLTVFHFVENSRAELGNPPGQPADPFPIREPADPFPVAAAASASALQQLQPIQLDRLSPLLPLREIDLQPLPVLVVQ